MKDKDEDLRRLRDVVAEKAVLSGKFTLASGLEASRYFDLKQVLLCPEGACLVGKVVSWILTTSNLRFVGGYGLGGWLMTATTVVMSGRNGRHPISGFEVEEDKGIKGHLPSVGEPVAVVDDVLTTGKSLLVAMEAVIASQRRVKKAIVILDRQQGGLEELQRKGYDVVALLRVDASGEIRVS